MAISCTAQDLVNNARCYECIPKGQRKAVIIYLLCAITGIAPDAQALMDAAAAYQAVPIGFRRMVESDLLIVTLGGGSAPNPPANPHASDGGYPDFIRVSWTNSPSASYYEIWKSTTPDSSTATLIATSPGSPYDDYAITPGVTYYYWVKTVSPTGVSGFSAMATGTVLDPPTVTAPDDFNYFQLDWPDFAPGQRYLVTMLQQGVVRDYVQDLNMGERSVQINNAFWDSSGVRIDHTVDWPLFWITSADGTKATATVQPHWPLVTTPVASIAGCNGTPPSIYPATFTYYPTSNRSSPEIQLTPRYFEVFLRKFYDLDDPTHPYSPVTMSGDVGDVMKFTTDLTSPNLATTNPSYGVPNGAGVDRLYNPNAFLGAVKCRACRNDGSGFVSPETTIVIDRFVINIAQCDTYGPIGSVGKGPVLGMYYHRVSPGCVPVTSYGTYHDLGTLEQEVKFTARAGGPPGFLSRVVAAETLTGHTDTFGDVGICPGDSIINLFTAAATCRWATNWIFAVPANYPLVPSNIASNVFLGDTLRASYGPAHVAGPTGSAALIESGATALMSGAAHPGGSDMWNLCTVLFTVCNDSPNFGPISV